MNFCFWGWDQIMYVTVKLTPFIAKCYRRGLHRFLKCVSYLFLMCKCLPKIDRERERFIKGSWATNVNTFMFLINTVIEVAIKASIFYFYFYKLSIIGIIVVSQTSPSYMPVIGEIFGQ